MIRIVSGWSNPGGSTVAHINLCNLFNASGLNCIFYGPHTWHLNKCKSRLLDHEFSFDEDDTVIIHCLKPIFQKRPKRIIYSCHETDVFPIADINIQNYDIIHYVSDFQKKWHNVDYPSIIIPNVIEDLEKSPLNTGCAGIIGSIDKHKQTHLAINMALKDGYRKVYLYGDFTDLKYKEYFIDDVCKVLLEKGIIVYKGHEDNKQKMYDSIDCVYNASKRETFNFVKFECEKTGVSYKSLNDVSPGVLMSNEEILNKWKENIYQAYQN